MNMNQFMTQNLPHMRANLSRLISQYRMFLQANPKEYLDDGSDTPAIDVRLCIDGDENGEPKTWLFRTGLSDFDPVHSRYCAASCITQDTQTDDLLRELISQVVEQAQ